MGLTQTPEHWPFVGDTGSDSTGVEVDAAWENRTRRVTAECGGREATRMRFTRLLRH